MAKKTARKEISEEGLSSNQKAQLRSAKAYLRQMIKTMADPDSTPFDLELSQKYSKESKLKACFENCYKLFLYSEKTDFPFKKAKYVEGYVWNQEGPQITIHHAWIELDGKIVDPTRIVLAKKTKAVFNWHYKAKRRVSGKRLMMALAEGQIPLLDE